MNGPVEDIVAVFQIDHLLDGTGIHAGQAADGFQEMAIGARIILGPQRQAQVMIAGEASRSR